MMSSCVGSPTNGSEEDRRASGRGDASIGPSWAPCEVSAELSIVGAASGGSDVRGRRELIKAGSELSKARCAHSSPSDSGGKASPGCVVIQGEVLRTQRRVLSQLFSGWVMVAHGLRVQPDSVLLCGNAVSEKSEALEILITVCEVGRRQMFCRVLKGRLSRSVGDARGMTILAG